MCHNLNGPTALAVLISAALIAAPRSGACQRNTMTNPTTTVHQKPVFEADRHARFALKGMIGDRIMANRRNWLVTAPDSNPAMLQMFADRDRLPERDLLPWSGEFVGKYLTSAVECYRLDRAAGLRKTIQKVVDGLIASQGEDGYMGPFSREKRWFGKDLWDLWGQYHCMLGLLRRYEESGDPAAMKACRRTADLFCKVFLDGKRRVIEAGSEEMNESCIHIFTLLFEETGEPRYLELARQIEQDLETPPSGDYVRASLAGKAFYQLPKPRWEGLHAVQGIAELYFITGDPKYRKALEQIWWTIAEFDRHNTGGFSSGEQAQGNPYDPRAIETCCTIAWMAVSVDVLRMTGDPHVADELELSTYNAVLGAQEPNGRWWTYNTPMDGERRAGTQDIAFQARPGSPELSCCSVNGPRGLGMLSDWAVMKSVDGVVLNYFGPGDLSIATPSGKSVVLAVDSNYPATGNVRVRIRLAQPEAFALRVRIPGWSSTTSAEINGEALAKPEPGTYLKLDRTWRDGDILQLRFDMGPRVWVGERECEGKASVYWGPILLAYDARYGDWDVQNLPQLDLTAKPSQLVAGEGMVRLSFPTRDGKTCVLGDFATAGMAGNRYVSWLPYKGLKPAAFSRNNPLRLVRP